jgi:hypothetical protein
MEFTTVSFFTRSGVSAVDAFSFGKLEVDRKNRTAEPKSPSTKLLSQKYERYAHKVA